MVGKKIGSIKNSGSTNFGKVPLFFQHLMFLRQKLKFISLF
jgi:hypothetical protein